MDGTLDGRLRRHGSRPWAGQVKGALSAEGMDRWRLPAFFLKEDSEPPFLARRSAEGGRGAILPTVRDAQPSFASDPTGIRDSL
jgi:hypothetical protein